MNSSAESGKVAEDLSRPLTSSASIPPPTQLACTPHPSHASQLAEPNKSTPISPYAPGAILATQVDFVPDGSNPTPKPLAPLHFFGVEHPMLPPAGTVPSSKHPIVNPVPVTLGLFPDTYCCRQKNPLVLLIHASRNPFLAGQEDVLGVLTADTTQGCPSYSPGVIHFWHKTGVSYHLNLLEQLEAQGILARTGYNLIEPCAKEVRILLPVVACSKVCWGCGRWEQLRSPDVNGVRHYGRLKRCQGCGQSFFCNTECQMKSWYKHSPHCVAMKEHYNWDPDRDRARGAPAIQ
ncbi:hypothetical protein C7212DRAFT_366273 [Tuber magnatum]|uniref:MYND-type domain-containing protein n=1 Tax=Tuber magnatum TaxID=42249 RepID=A0A317SHZ6_9PEZI|nr:hypothetical protein C7212DRAFT_366273 [Tuber magnatum]